MGKKHGRNKVNYTRVLTRNGGYSSTETERLRNSKGKRKQPMSVLSRVGKGMIRTELGHHSGEVETGSWRSHCSDCPRTATRESQCSNKDPAEPKVNE